MFSTEQLIWFGGLIHLSLLSASFSVPFVLDWEKELAPLSPFLRRLFWVYGAFIVLVIVGFGVLSILNAESLSNGTSISRLFCAFVAVFWTFRLTIQCFVFDIRALCLARWVRAGYHTLTVAFVTLVLIYGGAALGLYP